MFCVSIANGNRFVSHSSNKRSSTLTLLRFPDHRGLQRKIVFIFNDSINIFWNIWNRDGLTFVKDIFGTYIRILSFFSLNSKEKLTIIYNNVKREFRVLCRVFNFTRLLIGIGIGFKYFTAEFLANFFIFCEGILNNILIHLFEHIVVGL